MDVELTFSRSLTDLPSQEGSPYQTQSPIDESQEHRSQGHRGDSLPGDVLSWQDDRGVVEEEGFEPGRDPSPGSGTLHAESEKVPKTASLAGSVQPRLADAGQGCACGEERSKGAHTGQQKRQGEGLGHEAFSPPREGSPNDV